jgi:hypothetical protein
VSYNRQEVFELAKFVSTQERLPQSCSIEDECNPYYVVKVHGWGLNKAMFIDGKWYLTYIAVIVADVVAWFDEEDGE